MEIKISHDEENKLRQQLETRHDPEAERMKRFLAMPDLTRTANSPIHEIVKRILAMPDYKDFDVIEVPEIVPMDVSFDLFDFPKDHPARSKSDTYYVDDHNILRTHTTVMWNYYLAQDDVKKRMAEDKPVGSFSYGKVYRKDEIDRNHMNVFHQMDGWYLAPKPARPDESARSGGDQEVIGIPELEKDLVDIAKAVFGPEVKYRFNPDTFPYTDPSLEMEVEVNGRWIEVLGCGIMTDNLIRNLGLDPAKWSNWAFGFGLERLAIISMDLPDIRLLWSEDERVKKQLKL